jgi:hypothetical protein
VVTGSAALVWQHYKKDLMLAGAVTHPCTPPLWT